MYPTVPQLFKTTVQAYADSSTITSQIDSVTSRTVRNGLKNSECLKCTTLKAKPKLKNHDIDVKLIPVSSKIFKFTLWRKFVFTNF